MDNDTSEYDGQSLCGTGSAPVAHLGGPDRRRPADSIRPARTSACQPAVLAGYVHPGVSCPNPFAFTQSSFYPLADWREIPRRNPATVGVSNCLRSPDVLCASEPHTRSPIPARHRTDRSPTRHRGWVQGLPDHFGRDRGAATYSRVLQRDPLGIERRRSSRRWGDPFLAGSDLLALADRHCRFGCRVVRSRDGCPQTA